MYLEVLVDINLITHNSINKVIYKKYSIVQHFKICPSSLQKVFMFQLWENRSAVFSLSAYLPAYVAD